MLTMRPPEGMYGMAAWEVYKVLKVLMANAVWISWGVSSTSRLPWPLPVPALLTGGHYVLEFLQQRPDATTEGTNPRYRSCQCRTLPGSL
jgi:hypothetical protein